MKRLSVLTLLLLTIFSAPSLFAQDAPTDYLFRYGENKEKTLGAYFSTSGSYSTVQNDAVGYLGVRGGVVLNNKWGIGLAGYALNYDKALSSLVDDGTYRMQAGYTGLYVEYLMNFTPRLNLSLFILSGQGIVFYEYDKEFKEGRPWYEETIDQETFAVFEPGAEFQFRFANKWWIGAQITYRTTSPVQLQGVGENFLEQVNTGLFFKYGLF